MTLNLENGSTSVKLRCFDLGENPRDSLLFSIQVICGPKSVFVLPPDNFKQITY
jgi:hypothetical protein